MRNVVSDAGDGVDQRFDLPDHRVDRAGELRERIATVANRQPFVQAAGDDALDTLVDVGDPAFAAETQQRAQRQAQQ